MRGVPVFVLAAFVALLVAAPAARAQTTWPAYSTGSPDQHFIDRGPPGEDAGGWYLNSWKLFGYWVVFLFWVRSADWVNRDLLALGDRLGLSYPLWNAMVALPFIAAFLFFGLCFPTYLLSFPLMFISYLVPFAAYVVHRNSLVRDDERVFTPKNVSDWF